MKMNMLHSGIFGLAAAAVLMLSACTASQKTENNGSAKSDSLSTVTPVAAGDIAYFNLDEVIAGYDRAADLMSEFENKANKELGNLERKGKQIQSDYQKLVDNAQKGLILQSSAEKQAQDIQTRQEKFNQEYAKKQEELANEQAVINNNVMNDIAEFLKTYNETRGFRMILTNQTGLLSIPVALADPGMNITADIISGLNEAYVASK